MTTALQEHTELLNTRIKQLIAALIANYEKQYNNSSYYQKEDFDFEVVPGTKYLKLIMVQRGSRSVHAFINKQTGTVYKPASWRAPAKHARYQLMDDASFEECLKRADWAGGYLYLS
jgi:hypothetical protein